MTAAQPKIWMIGMIRLINRRAPAQRSESDSNIRTLYLKPATAVKNTMIAQPIFPTDSFQVLDDDGCVRVFFCAPAAGSGSAPDGGAVRTRSEGSVGEGSALPIAGNDSSTIPKKNSATTNHITYFRSMQDVFGAEHTDDWPV